MQLATYAISESIEFKETINGNVYVMSGDMTISADTSQYFLIKTGEADVLITHVGVRVDGAETLIQGFSDSAVSADGSMVTIANTNRVLKNQPKYTGIYSGPTVTSDGDKVIHEVAYASSSEDSVTIAGAHTGDVYLLAKNTSNLFKLTNRDNSNSVKVSYKLKFIETEL